MSSTAMDPHAVSVVLFIAGMLPPITLRYFASGAFHAPAILADVGCIAWLSSLPVDGSPLSKLANSPLAMGIVAGTAPFLMYDLLLAFVKATDAGSKGR